MSIISEFVREQKRYSKRELKHIFSLSVDDINGFIRNLKAFGVLKTVKNNTEQKNLSDLLDEDIVLSDETEEENYFYVFTYVGIITIGSRVIKCYPKYLLYEDKPVKELKKVLKVLGRYGSKNQIINLFNGDNEGRSFNALAVTLFLLNDYFENGIYCNEENIVEINGDGEILWAKTIDENFAFIKENRPYYMEFYTSKTVDDEQDFFRQLHEFIITDCSNKLNKSDLLDLFDLTEVMLTDVELDFFGDLDYILYKIQNEVNNQFNTRKQVLLKTLYTYIANYRNIEDNYGISMYGTNSFNLVWEDICGQVFCNKLHSRLDQLRLPVPVNKDYNASDKLIDIIEKPVWIGYDAQGSHFYKNAKDTLIPDIISIEKTDDMVQFTIIDAKYYNLQLEENKNLRGNPGIGDVTKQYLYQLAFIKFINDHQIKKIRNFFAMPSQYDKILNKGCVQLEILKSLGLKNIQICWIPADMMYDLYLTNNTLNITDLNL